MVSFRGSVRLAAVVLACVATATAQDSSQPLQEPDTTVRRTTLVVADAGKSIDFYQNILGFRRWYYSEGTVTEGSLPADGARIGDPSVFAIMKGKDPWIGMVGLLQKGPARGTSGNATDFAVSPGDTILMIETSDLDGIYQRMLTADTPIWKHPETTTVTGAGGRQWDATFLFAFDPDGHLLEINQPHFDAAAKQTIRRAFADTRMGQLHYRSTPERTGVPLVLLHQTPLSGRMYRHLLPLLADRRQVLAPDTPGYGESDLSSPSPAIGDYADALVDWLDVTGVARIDLFGYHTGAAIAVDLAARYPDRVRSLILMSVPLFSADEMADWPLEEKKIPADGSHLTAMWNSSYSHRDPRQTTEMIAVTVAEKQRAGSNESLALRALREHDLLQQLRTNFVPTSFISPGDGLQDATRRAAETTPARVGFEERSDWGYGIFDTEAEEIARLINLFIDDHEDRLKP